MDMPHYDDIFKQLKLNFWLIGIPWGNVGLTIRFFICLLSLSLIVIEEAAFLVSKVNTVNMLELTQLAPCTGVGVLSVVKVIAISMKRRKIFELSENLSRLYSAMKFESETGPVIRSQMVSLKKLVRYFFILNAMLISVYNFSTPVMILYNYLRNGEASFILPYQVLLPFEINSWTIWGLVYTHSIISGFICVLYFSTIDVLYSVLTTHICINFTHISHQLKHMNKSNPALRDIVKNHQYILKLSEDLEDIFTAPNLFNVLVGSVMICALGFNLAMGDLKQIPGCILFLASVLLQILMMSVFGENIITESRKVGDAAYTCEWYEMEEKIKKDILTVMIRSKRPAKLTAYKFSTISYGSFCTILSTSWSYFTILRTVYTPSETS
uniref:Odorant receptor n=1 Tax=Semiothisa cinerearia TaxID=2249628 RepID=A0A889XLB1_9NEOP|nr:odorant receptor [Semiothisa cinerearia]